MKNKRLLLLLLAGLTASALPLAAEEDGNGTRTIRLLQDDAQINLATKVYELKYVKATDIRPYVQAAVKRYHAQSTVERVNYSPEKKNFLIVSTGEEFLPYVDDIIKKIDKPGKVDEYGSILEGTGITRISYTPNYRASEDIVRIINLAIKSAEGYAYLNKDTNTIYWKDDKVPALANLAWVQRLDRPVPQVNLRLNYYEVRESTLRDIGVDYLAWKNGPGLNIFEAAYNGGNAYSNESILQTIAGNTQWIDLAKDFSTSWGYGGFFTAPQFDLSFVRLLQQSGNAKVVGTTNLTFVNTALYDDPALNQYRTYYATLTPDYQNIQKNDTDRTQVVPYTKTAFDLVVNNPVICFGAETGEIDNVGAIPSDAAFYSKNNGGVVFQYKLQAREVVERNNRGTQLGNSSTSSGSLTLGFKTEKLLSSYTKENDVEETIGVPFLSDIPYLKYLFGTTTTLKEKTFIIVTAEAALVHPELVPPPPVNPVVEAEELN